MPPDTPIDHPNWLDTSVYPFESHTFVHDAGRVHYLDEGDGDPVVCLHGNPTWSFLYRHVIHDLRDDYRCLAPDYLGFGLSEKPRDFPYTPEAHAGVVADLLDHLDLHDVTLVVQDWGGPIGLDWATRNPDRVRAVVAGNTFAWPLAGDRRVRWFSRVLGSRLGKLAVTRLDAFVRVVMPLVYADRSRLTLAIHRQYRRPFETPADRTGAWVFPRELVGSGDWLARLWDRRDALADTPHLLVWGTADPAFGPRYLARWRRLRPDAEVVTFDDCGHYLQEERGPELADAVRAFLAGLATEG